MRYSSTKKNVNKTPTFATKKKITVFEWERLTYIINLHPYTRLKKEILVGRRGPQISIFVSLPKKSK